MGYFISNRGLPFNKAYKGMASYARDTQSGLASDEINPWYFQFCIRCLAHIIAGLKHIQGFGTHTEDDGTVNGPTQAMIAAAIARESM